MAELDAMHTIIMQVAIQVAGELVMELKEEDTGSVTASDMAKTGEVYRSQHSKPALRQPAFDWKAPDKYIKLLNVDMEETNMLQTRVHKLNNKEKVPIIKHMSKKWGNAVQTFTNSKKEACKRARFSMRNLNHSITKLYH